MSGRHYYKHRRKEEDIDVTPMLNVMVVLIAFLILSAVFSNINIQELVLPAQSDGSNSSPDKPQVTIEVIVRRNSMQISDGKTVLANLPTVAGKYDLQDLSKNLLRLKAKYKDKQDISVLLEPDIEYEYLIQVMDAVKTSVVTKEGQEGPQRVPLFPEVSIGDAP